jgi:hypothetical protein
MDCFPTDLTLSQPPHTVLLAGHDSLVCGYYLQPEPGSPFDFATLLIEREALRSSGSRHPLVVTLGDAELLLNPYGSTSGYPLVLTGPDWTIECGEFNRPSFYVTFRSEALWRYSAANVHDRFLAWAQSAGLAIERPESVSRVDWSFDYHLPVLDFDESHFVSAASKDAKYREGGRIQTLIFGRGDVVLRVYDKIAEIEQQSHKTWLLSLWGGVCEDVWRIEWQARKGLLRQFGIRTLDSLFEREGDVLRYLSSEHTTLRAPSEDSNRSRWPLHSLWQDLQQRIGAMESLGARRTDTLAAALDERLIRSIISVYGYLKRIAAIHVMQQGRYDVLPLALLLPELRLQLQRIHDPLAWNDDVRKRIDEMRLGPW